MDDYGFECFIPEDGDMDEDELVAGNALQDAEDAQLIEDSRVSRMSWDYDPDNFEG